MPISVRLEKNKCRGCTHCVRVCPTRAIRVRFGISHILEEKCIDCGHCVLVCPQNAKKAVSDSLDRIGDFKHTVVMPSPSLFGQFHNLSDVNIVLQALLDLGFDEVFEPSAAEELITALTLRDLDEGFGERPLISTGCPVVVRLISRKFPNLITHIMKYLAPAELAAKVARERAKRKTGLDDSDIGVFFIAPCPADVTEAHYPLGLKEPVINYVLSMTEIYKKLLPLMDGTKQHADLRTTRLTEDTEAKVRLRAKYNAIACDGISDIIKLLDAADNKRLRDVDFLELFSCMPECVGGCLTVENPFAARARFRKLPVDNESRPFEPIDETLALRTEELEYAPTGVLDPDFKKALEKMKRAEELNSRLPGLDCGSCGSPGCRELAQDVVMGLAEETDCVFNARAMMEDGGSGQHYLPPPFRKEVK